MAGFGCHLEVHSKLSAMKKLFKLICRSMQLKLRGQYEWFRPSRLECMVTCCNSMEHRTLQRHLVTVLTLILRINVQDKKMSFQKKSQPQPKSLNKRSLLEALALTVPRQLHNIQQLPSTKGKPTKQKKPISDLRT